MAKISSLIAALCAVLFLSAPALSLTLEERQKEERDLRSELSFATHYVKEYEAEVTRSRGGGGTTLYRNQAPALSRVRSLMERYPDDPRVQELYDRVRSALKRSKGDYIEITPDMVLYTVNEENMRKHYAEISAKAWNDMIAKVEDKIIRKPFPTPDFDTVALDDLKDKYVILDDVQYPRNQFLGASGEYVSVGKPSAGYYYVDVRSRRWLGPYEAVKRYRRQVDTTMANVDKWTVLGKITAIAAEIPEAGQQKVGTFRFGWVVAPVALYVPGHVLGFYDAAAESSGYFVGEDEVERIKQSWYTVTSVPDDVTPERLMEIFMAAIKEKNYSLYVNCIDPKGDRKDIGAGMLMFHWDAHQRRFHQDYVHGTFGKAKLSVIKGFDEKNDMENFFLEEQDKEQLRKIGGTKVEQAIVESRGWDANGRQVGQPNPHRLRRVGGGRWYVYDFGMWF